jgi:long-chain acyl-CoA synthetase
MALRTGLISAERHRSHDEVERHAMQGAAGLRALGVEPGQAIAVLMRNDFAFFEASYAAQAAGVYAVPINWHLSPAEIDFILRDSEAKVLVVHADMLRPITERVPEGVIILTVPTPPEIVNAYSLDPSEAALLPGAVLWDEWLAGFEPLAEAYPQVTETMMYTSGTTGTPKGVRRDTSTAEDAAQLGAMRDQVYGIKPGIRGLLTGPLYHAAPNSFALRAGKIADALVIMPRFDAEDCLALIEREQITTSFMVPTMFVRMLKLADDVRANYDLSSLNFIMHAAAPCPSEIKRRMIDWLGPIVNEFYGGTEGGYWTISNSEQWLAKPGTVGRPPDGVTLKALGEDGNEMPVGQPGELYGKLHCFPDFTYNKRDEARRDVGRGDLITIGDIGYFDEDGFVFICDRAKDMVVSGGANIYPAEIEAELSHMSGVADSAVFGIPDPEFGEKLMAIVQLHPGAEVSGDAIMDHLRRHLAGFKVPRLIEFRDTLPRGDDGKIYKRRLRDPYWEGHERRV